MKKELFVDVGFSNISKSAMVENHKIFYAGYLTTNKTTSYHCIFEILLENLYSRRNQLNAIEHRLAIELIKINRIQSFDWFSIDRINQTAIESIERQSNQSNGNRINRTAIESIERQSNQSNFLNFFWLIHWFWLVSDCFDWIKVWIKNLSVCFTIKISRKQTSEWLSE